MRALLVLVAAAVVPLSGCIGILSGADAGDVREAVLDQFQALIDADVERYLSYYADDYVDLGGGDGTPYTKDERRRHTKEFFASEEYEDGFGGIKTPGDALLLDTYRTWGQKEFTTDPELRDWADGYASEKEDVFVWIDDRDGDPWLDGGWGGFYRPSGGSWVQVAGD